MRGDAAPPEGIPIPLDRLSEEALTGIIDEFTTREGTDYGREYSLSEKRAHVLAQLRRGDVVILFDPKTETTNLVRVKH